MALSRARRLMTAALTVLVVGLILFPVYWMLLASSQGPRLSSPSLLPRIDGLSLAAYASVFADLPFARWFANTVIVAVATTVCAVVLSTLSSYALSRFNFRGKGTFAVAVIVTQLLPGIVIAVPIYVLLSGIGLLNSYPGLVLGYLARTLPFAMWMLWSYFDSIPVDIEQAAMVDGADRMQSLLRVVLPLSGPGLVAVSLFTFVSAWEEYLLPLMMTSSDDMLTLTVGASRLVSEQSFEWGKLMAYSVLMTLPIGVIFVYLQRFLVEGMTAGSVKG